MPDPLDAYDPIFEEAGKAWNVDPTLLKAVAMQESFNPKTGTFNPRAVGTSGEQGIMQIAPGTQRLLGVADPFDPVQSIFGGAKYLSEALDKEGNPAAALAYYNGGPGWRKSYDPNKGYVRFVTDHYSALVARQQQAPPAPPAASDSAAPPTQPYGAQPPVAAPVGPQAAIPRSY